MSSTYINQTIDSCRQYILLVGDSNFSVEKRAKAASELADQLESIATNQSFTVILADFLKVFTKTIQEIPPNFYSENPQQQLRKHLLECIHRIPTSEVMRQHVKTILSHMFQLIEIDNEENVLICLRIIIEMHKQYRPAISGELHSFLANVKKIYQDLQKPANLAKVFEPQTNIRLKDNTEIDIPTLLNDTYTTVTVHVEKRDGTTGSTNSTILPKATMSLKVMAEVPIIIVLMYQLYKQNVMNTVAEFIPLIMNTIILQPSAAQRSSVNFSKEIYCDFVAAQVKTLSFIAFIIRFYLEIISQHQEQLLKGMLTLFQTCPPEVAHLRKELLIAARHILATELRRHFVPIIEQLFDENLLIGSGWTAYDSLRPLAYSTLADLVHHVRNHLKFSDICLAVNLFSKNVMDETLPCSIQTMSCKLLLNLVECIRTKSETENENGRDLLVRMLEVFVLKFKSISELQLPALLEKCKTDSKKKDESASTIKNSDTDNGSLSDGKTNEERPPLPDYNVEKDPDKVIPGISQPPNYLASECRTLVKTLICGVKTITWGTTTCKSSILDPTAVANKRLSAKETLVFIRLVTHGLNALDIYMINVTNTGTHCIRPASLQACRTKDEKEVLEHFGGVFTMMYHQTFKEIFVNTIDFMVDRMHQNYSIQVVANSFLANVQSSSTFATILVDYLLRRLPEMGTNSDRSALYLKLFKLVFGSVSLFSAENEPMLKPHLHDIVNKSIELAKTAKDPYNYFLLLRALFRSIGGGSHDLLYQEFLPLLPNLLQGLNSLQSGPHKQHMKDLFVELCLTVPVRLSSLLPYLPMLMDPLVSALNGGSTLVSQGLRTLELCVDNLQPDFLYEHIQPVRAELMQALWTTLRNPSDQIAHIAFRVLGKFGGANRKMLSEPQKLKYFDKSSSGPILSIQLDDMNSPISLPIELILDTAYDALKVGNTDEFIKNEAWEIVKCYLVASLEIEEDDNDDTMLKILKHESFKNGPIISQTINYLYKSGDNCVRDVHKKALTAMFVALSNKSLKENVLPYVRGLIRHYVMVACCHQGGPFPLIGEKPNKLNGLDPHILIDAICSVIGHEENDLEKYAIFSLHMLLETSITILTDLDRACQLPLFEYLCEKISILCYERAWYSKMGGCIGIKFCVENLSLTCLLEHQYTFVKGLLYVLMDLTDEVSSGSVDEAKRNLKLLLERCSKKILNSNENLLELQKKSISDVTHELIKQVTSPNTLVREQSIESLHFIAKVLGVTLTELILPLKDVLQEMLPPKKHLLKHQPINSQIGIMEGNTFCSQLDSSLFSIDLNTSEHKIFFNELMNLCESEDNDLQKIPCYKSASTLIPLRIGAMRALASCHNIADKREKIFEILFNRLKSDKKEIQNASAKCMKTFLSGFDISTLDINKYVKVILNEIGQDSACTKQYISILACLADVMPSIFEEHHMDSLVNQFISWLEIVPQKQMAKADGYIFCPHIKICLAVMDILNILSSTSSKYLRPILESVIKCEMELMTECSSPFVEALKVYVLKFPSETIELFLSDSIISHEKYVRFFFNLVDDNKSIEIRRCLENQQDKLINLCKSNYLSGNESNQDETKNLLQFVGIKLVRILSFKNENWLAKNNKIVATLVTIWVSSKFQDKHQHVDSVDYEQWEEPQLLVECLIMFAKSFPNQIELLFQILRCFVHRYAVSMQFVKDFITKFIVESYSIQWKRDAFFKFIDIFHNPDWSQDLKANILKHVLIPTFAYSFENNHEKLIEGMDSNEQDDDSETNIVNVFITKIIDPDKPNSSDAVRILVLQFASLLVEYASQHIHDGQSANKKDGKEGNKLRRLMTYAWPCLLVKTCVDPSTRYNGHLLLCHIIAKFAIHKRIVLQVFHSLLKAYAVEARNVVKQALNVVVPTLPNRMEDSNVSMLVFWTRKMLVEEGHSIPHLTHILQLVVRHFKVYYTVRSGLIMYLISSISRMAFTPSSTMENRKLAVEVCEVLIKWEIMRLKEEEESRLANDQNSDSKRRRLADNKSMEKHHCDNVVTSLMRISCQVNDATASVITGDLLSKKCVQLIKLVLRPDVWPNVELKLGWLDKLFQTVDGTSSPNYGNIICGLDLLSILTGFLKRHELLQHLRTMQKGLVLCLRCQNTRVIRTLNIFLTKLMTIFPTEPPNSTNVASKHEELEMLYANATKLVFEGLSNYDKIVERSQNMSPSQLFGTLMILKAACVQNQLFIDRLLTTFYKVLQKISKEHWSPSTSEANTTAITCELLILSLDLVKNRVGSMSQEMRKNFIGTVLTTLIEKSTDSKVIKAITKMVEDWVKIRNVNQMGIHYAPSTKEKVLILAKLMVNIDKRFSEEKDLQAQFLELVRFIYLDEEQRGSEMTAKLEAAFMLGLRCGQHSIRQKFFQVFDSSVNRSVDDRLLYILQSQSWESIGTHFWIKQCIQLLLILCSKTLNLNSTNCNYFIPSVSSIIKLVNDQSELNSLKSSDNQDIQLMETSIEMEMDNEFDCDNIDNDDYSSIFTKKSSTMTVDLLVKKQKNFYNSFCRNVKMHQFTDSLSELCHSNTNLSYHLWIDFFPRLYKVLPENTQNFLNGILPTFLISPQHLGQKDIYPSAANCFLEAICKCLPQVSIRASIVKYLGKSHNLWHRAVLILEQMAIDGALNSYKHLQSSNDQELETSVTQSLEQHEILDSLCELYTLLKEDDMLIGIWTKRAKYTETIQALSYEQHGQFEQAQNYYETCMTKARQEHNTENCSSQSTPEYELWLEHWIKCAKELNQWEQLLDYCNIRGQANPQLAMECAWHVPNWAMMRDAINQVDGHCPKEIMWRVNLYKGYIHVCNPDEQHFQSSPVDKFVDTCGNCVIKEWRRLPHIVSHIHIQYLQASQQVMELFEASQIHTNLQANASSTATSRANNNALHDMKAIVKTWRNRLPMISDDLSHWSDIFTWRHHHYQFIVNHYNSQQSQTDTNQATNAMLGVHASAQAIIHFGKIARKHSQTTVCLDQLSRIHTIASVPIVDCFNKIRQQVKCYLQMSSVMGKNELQEGLEVIESTNLKYFTKEMTAEFYALKGMFLAQIGRSEDANKAFSAAVQMHDTLVKAWALWGDYLEILFTRDRNIQIGVSAITCFLHACRHQNESKSRKYLAKVLWLLTYDEADTQILAEAVDKYNIGVPPIQWLTWIPQLLTCLIRNEGKLMLNLLTQVGRMYPQAVYFPIRTLYLTLKLEQRERVKSSQSSQIAASSPQPVSSPLTPQPNVQNEQVSLPQTPVTPQPQPQMQPQQQQTCPIKATASMWRCSKIMHTQRELHPSILSSLEGIVDQFVWFRERWHEEVLRQLRQALTKCYTLAFESRQVVSEASISPHTRNFIKKIVSTFGTGLEQVSTSAVNVGSTASESLARRAQLSRQDPVFQRMKQQFTTDFDFNQPSCTKLHMVMNKLKKWIKILEAKNATLSKSFLIEEKCRFLSNFSPSTAEVELPGEFLLPKASHTHYYVRISRFMPTVEIVDKYGTAARRIYIRGQNGKIYPYLIVSDRMMIESRREERILQLLRMLNHFLHKQKETSRRHLTFTVPRVVAVSPHTQMIEDNLSSISLWQIYKQLCCKRGVEADTPIARYYERVATVQARGNSASHQVLREILKEVQNNTVPKTLLKEWALQILPNATEFWTFRKNLTLQLALAGLAEFVLHLTRANIDMMYVHRDCGFLDIAYFKFDVDDETGDLHSNRPVPFRLTPNIAELIAPTGVNGPLAGAMLAAARCFVQPQYKFSALLKAIMRDEYITWHKKQQDEKNLNAGNPPTEMEGELLIQMVQKATTAIMTRLQSLACLDNSDSKVSTLIAAANSLDNLCRMDPAWHPWL